MPDVITTNGAEIMPLVESLNRAGDACDAALRRRDESRLAYEQAETALESARRAFYDAQKALLIAAQGGARERWLP